MSRNIKDLAFSRWDWFQSTAYGPEFDDFCRDLQAHFPLSDIGPGRAKNGYLYARGVYRGDVKLAEVWAGGNPGIHIIATGDRAPDVAAFLRAGRYEHHPTRVDACLDYICAGFFDDVTTRLRRFATSKGLQISMVGDWHRGEGRTLYLGSPRSVVRLVVYEKGYEAGGDKDWTRLEARVRPHKASKELVAQWEPRDAFRASRWITGAMSAIGLEQYDGFAVGTVCTTSDTQRARNWMIKQYGPTLREWARELGTYEQLGIVIGQLLSDVDSVDERSEETEAI